jgi:hypothetical protein
MESREPKYWLNLFTGTTWAAFQGEGAAVCGFNERWKNIAATIRPGDVFICYLTGVMRWVGALNVRNGPYRGTGPQWTSPSFPLLFDVSAVLLLEPEYGVPMTTLEGKVDFFLKPSDRNGYKQFLRRCPSEFRRPGDGKLIVDLMREAKQSPIKRPVTESLLMRRPSFRKTYRSGT